MLPWIGCDKFLMNGGRTFEETPMPTIVAPIPGAFAGQVFGVDCAAPLTGADVASIDAAMDQHAVLIFRDQPLNDEQQLTFTRRFGQLERYETPGHIRKREEERLAGGIADFSNLTRDGSVMSPEDRVWLFKLGDRLWHSDPFRRNILCYRGERSLHAAVTQNLQTCAPPTVPWMKRRRRRSRTSSANIR
jgi:Taurine catabolism dioxygenase TauD, TfdA family